MFEEDGGQVEADVVEEHEVLVELAHVADVRDDGNAEFFAHDAHGQEFADSGDADGIHLDEPGTFHLEVVLEDDKQRSKKKSKVVSPNLHHNKNNDDDNIIVSEELVGINNFQQTTTTRTLTTTTTTTTNVNISVNNN